MQTLIKSCLEAENRVNMFSDSSAKYLTNNFTYNDTIVSI